jgi:phosphohistidine phosphatase SixA
MLHSKQEAIALVKVFEEVLAGMQESEYKALIQGEGTLIFQPLNVMDDCEVLKKTKQTKTIGHNSDIGELVLKLSQAQSREEAYQVLSSNLKKATLLEIASTFVVHIRKNENKETIIHKIIEGVVGARLRSKAIKETEIRKRE